MKTMIALPDDLELLLRRKAAEENVSLEAFTLGILAEAVETSSGDSALYEVIARIKAMPRDPQRLRPASGSLAEALRSGPSDPEFDLAGWQANWSLVEADMNALTMQNDIAEGLG